MNGIRQQQSGCMLIQEYLPPGPRKGSGKADDLYGAYCYGGVRADGG